MYPRFRQGAPECNCADPFSISCPVHNKESESGARSRAKEELKEEADNEEAVRMLNSNVNQLERREVLKQSGKTNLFNKNIMKREITF